MWPGVVSGWATDGRRRVAVSLDGTIASAVTGNARLVVAGCLLTSLVFAAGLPALETDTSLEQFDTETEERAALEVANERFEERDENTTAVQIVIDDDNALEREALLEGLALQQRIHEDERIEPTLVDERATVGVENVIATAIIRLETADELEDEADELEDDAADIAARIDELARDLETIESLQADYEALNRSHERGEIDAETYEAEAAEIEAAISDTIQGATADLDAEQTDEFERAAATLQGIEAERAALEVAHEAGNVSDATYEAEREQLDADREGAIEDGSQWVFAEELTTLREAGERLEDEREALQRIDQPPLEAQIEALERADEAAVERAIALVLADDGPGSEEALRLLPASYEPGSTTADERLLVVTQSLDRAGAPGERDEAVVDGQLALEELVGEWQDDDPVVFGFGLVEAEVDGAVSDSIWLVGPLALVLVLCTLSLAYRDVLDIVLGLIGMATVLAWTLGFAGWAGFAFTQAFVAVPVLLIGLSIDYAIHVFMRYRERRADPADGDDVAGSMAFALAGVGLALCWVTATTALGFLANLVSPIAPIRDFGVVSAFGILSSLVVFGAMIPALKVELDSALEARGYDRKRRVLGRSNRLAAGLRVGSTLARRAPLVVIVCALLVLAGGVYGAVQVDTTFEEESFLSDEPPAWTERIGVVDPEDYRMKAALAHLEANYQRDDGRVQIVLTGDVTEGNTLQRVALAEAYADSSDAVYVLPGGEADVRSPLSAMAETAAESDSFNATFQLADRTGDGVPDQNLLGLYDGLHETNPEAGADVVYRDDSGADESIRLVVGIDSSVSNDEMVAEMRTMAAILEGSADPDEFDDDLAMADDRGEEPLGAQTAGEAVATGTPIVTYALERTLFTSVVTGLAVALVAVSGVLALGFRRSGHGATLGVITTVPVVVALGATLATMALFGVPFNVLTGMVASLTIGLGIAYAIHVSIRYVRELERTTSPWTALDRALTLTGGALAGSVLTTVVGFGVLVVATVPLLRQFGLVTAVTIWFAFLTSVLVLPTLLAVWTRWLAPERYRHPDLSMSLWGVERLGSAREQADGD